MGGGHSLGRRFGWLWAAYGTSALGTWLAFGAFPLIAVQVLHAGPAEVAALSAAGAAVGAAVAVPLGPWTEFRRKRPVMIATDLARCAALLSVPAAFALGVLGFLQLLLVSIVVAAADITFRAASGAYLKTLLPPEDLLVAHARFEATSWAMTIVGPPAGGAAIGLLGPVATVLADAVSCLLSALGIRAMGRRRHRPEWPETPQRPECPERPECAECPERSVCAECPVRHEAERRGAGRRGTVCRKAARRGRPRMRAGDLTEGWRHLLADTTLRPLFLNTTVFNALVMATQPLLAVLMLGRLGFAPWEYGLAFAVPAIGGLLGARLARPLVTRFGQHRVLVVAGALRAVWPLGLVFLGPGTGGLLLVIGVEWGLVFCCGVFNPVHATFRLRHTPPDRVARTLTAWAVTAKAATALLTATWGLLGGLLGPHTAIGLAGVLLLATPLLLPRRAPVPPAAVGLPARAAS
ncbi:MFS transporter [Streptomyces roseoviridis]|uniref:MFS transporter n=1 Tax=Streptomyces roseoviridis TaxID=67361 RepID=UPI0031EB1960